MLLCPTPAEPESPLVKTLIGGAVTLFLEVSGGHALEMVKITKQTSPQFGYVHITQQMTRHKGWIGILDGFLPW